MRAGFYRSYLLGLMATILAFNYVDRTALGLMLQNIKADLHLSDTQLGVLTGIAFAAFYSIMGVPIGRWADRGDRRIIVALTTALWSLAVMLSGFAQSFLQLLVIRVAVAVGEAGCIPTAHSLIPDYFQRSERPRAVSIYMLGGPLSVVLGYFLAGWLNELYGWRTTFLALGLPGMGLALLAAWTLREPRAERQTKQAPGVGSEQPGYKEVLVTLWNSRTFRHLLLCFSVTSFFGYGILQWQPAFFVRSYGLQTGELGTWFSVLYGVGGLLGTYLGGRWAARYASGNERLQLKAVALGYCSFSVSSALIYSSSSSYIAFMMVGVGIVGTATLSGPLFATIQTLVPERMRATSLALIYLFSNLIGMGLGPLTVGLLSDALRPSLGDESLRYALLILCPGNLWGAWHAWRASKTVLSDVHATLGSDS